MSYRTIGKRPVGGSTKAVFPCKCGDKRIHLSQKGVDISGRERRVWVCSVCGNAKGSPLVVPIPAAVYA